MQGSTEGELNFAGGAVVHTRMKIVSKFQDYYDGLRGMDREDEPLYVRMTKTISLNARDDDALRASLEAQPLWNPLTMLPHSNVLNAHPRVIGFCGRVYFYFTVRGRICFTFAQLAAAVALAVEQRLTVARPQNVEHDLDVIEEGWASLQRTCVDTPFVYFRAPVIEHAGTHLTLNPVLRPLGFATQLDAYSAWQELSMFLGNNMVSALSTPPRPISDVLKAESKGFDAKTSFRNQKNRKYSERGDW